MGHNPLIGQSICVYMSYLAILPFILAHGKCSENDLQSAVKSYIRNNININKPNENGETLLFQAADQGFIKVVKELLKLKSDVNQQNSEGKSPLNIASWNGNKDIVLYLLKHGADPNLPDSLGRTPIYSAAVTGHLDVIKTLKLYQAQLDIARDNGATALYQAAYGGHLNIVKYLVENEPSLLDRPKDSGATPFYIATFSGKLDVMRYLYEQRADIHRAKNDGVSPLIIACDKGHVEAVEFLIEHHCDVNKARDNGVTPLYIAAARGHGNIIHILIKAGAHVNVVTNEGASTVYAACYNDHMEALEILLENKGRVNLARNDGWTPLHIASQIGNLDIFKKLINKGATFDSLTSQIETPFMIAAEYGNDKILSFIQSEYPNHIAIDDLDIHGKSALYKASENGHSNVVEFLLTAGASMESGRDYDLHPLIAAVSNNHLETLLILLKNKDKDTNCLVTDSNGYTPLHHALLNTDVNTDSLDIIRELLSNNNCVSEIQGKYDRLAPIHIAAAMDVKDVVHSLITKHSASVNIQDQQGETALFKASLRGNYEVVKMLLVNKADVNLCTFSDLACPLCVAVLYGHTSVVQLLLSHNAVIDHTDRDLESPLFLSAQPEFHLTHSGIITPEFYLETGTNEDYLTIMKLLLAKGASKSLLRSDGKTAAEIAVLSENKSGYKLLTGDIVSGKDKWNDFKSTVDETEENDDDEWKDGDSPDDNIESKDNIDLEQGDNNIDASQWNWKMISGLFASFILVAISPMVAFKISCMLDDKDTNMPNKRGPSKAKLMDLNAKNDQYSEVSKEQIILNEEHKTEKNFELECGHKNITEFNGDSDSDLQTSPKTLFESHSYPPEPMQNIKRDKLSPHNSTVNDSILHTSQNGDEKPQIPQIGNIDLNTVTQTHQISNDRNQQIVQQQPNAAQILGVENTLLNLGLASGGQNIQSLTVNMVNVYHHHSTGATSAGLADPLMSREDLMAFHNGEEQLVIEGYSPYTLRCAVQNNHSRMLSNLRDTDDLAAQLFQIDAIDNTTLRMVTNEDYKKNSVLFEHLYDKPAWTWVPVLVDFVKERQSYMLNIIIEAAAAQNYSDSSE